MPDINAYFSRIGFSGRREPSVAALSAICRCQASAVTYENLDPFLGVVPSLAPEALYAKLVDRQRGGYCFELNALLRDALLALGMRVHALAARVVWNTAPDAPLRPRTHMLLAVETDGPAGPYLADVGFGGQLFGAPLLMEPDVVQRTADGVYRLRADGKIHTLETELAQGWAPMYQFDLEAHLTVDYEPANWFTATHPSSIFRHNLLLQRLTPEGRIGLVNDRLTCQHAGEAPQTCRVDNADDFEQVIRRDFGIALPVPAGELYARIPKGLDKAYVPSAR